MAVKINLKDGTGSKSENFKQEKTPATQGNVINTLDAYNEKIKKEYYDKNQARADENALQESIQKIVELLAKDTSFKSKTKPANTESEDTEKDRLEGYLGEFDEDRELAFDAAGLVRKINVIANLLSGNTDGNKGWKADVHGNNAGKDNSSLNAPVIGITRKDPEYSATIDKDTHELIISGLNEVVKDGEEDNVDVSDITVLSEKQVAHMISNTIRETLGTYDLQISNILAYLLIKDDLTEAQKYVLLHTYTEMTNEAPLFITYSQDGFTTNGTQISKPHYYIHDLNGGNYKEETKDFFIYENQYEAEKSPFLVKLSESDSEKLEVLVDGNLGYYIPIPQKTVTVDVGSIDDITGFSYDLSLFGKSFEKGKEITFKDGVFYINAPIGANVIIHIPANFIGNFFETNDNTNQNHRVNDEVVISNIEENVEIYTKNITYNVEIDKQIITQKKRLTEDFSIEITNSGILKAGYNSTATYGTVDRDKSKITLGITNIRNVDLVKNTVINDTVNFLPKTGVTVTVKNFDDDSLISTQGNQTVGEKLWYDLYENKLTGKKLICFYDENKNNEISTIPESDEPVVYAKYETLVYNGSFILNGGNWSTGQKPSETHEYVLEGADNTIIKPVKDGYTFLGWYTTPNFETLGEESVGSTGYLNEDCTYYARWKENTYTINFSLDGLLDGANPQFKYQSISVKTSNLPLTLGKAYADGYEFKGWALTSEITNVVLDAGSEENYVGHDTIKLSDFIDKGITEISLMAVWSTSNVDIIEEYYYEIDGEKGKYDLLESTKKTAKVSTVYSGVTYTPNKGFTESSIIPITVQPSGNVLKRYFNRDFFTVTYTGTEDGTFTWDYKYSDNSQEFEKVSDDLFDCWVDENGNAVSYIKAYHFGDFTVHARFNQQAPVLNEDFTVTTTTTTITISKRGSKGKLLINDGATTAREITDSNSYTLNYDDVYSEGVSTTKSCFVYFSGITKSNVNPSDLVEVKLIYTGLVPILGTDFDLDSSTSSVIKITDGLEYRIGDTNYVDLANNFQIGRNDTIYIRRKETFSRFASEDVSSSFNGKEDANCSTLLEQNFTVNEVSYREQGYIEISSSVFGGTHGPLQYQTGTGNAWLNVNRTETCLVSTKLYVDKPCTINFRYGESDEYYASSTTVSITVGIKSHTVTFDKSSIPSTEYTFTGLADGSQLTVDSGSQLCRVDAYIQNVDSWRVKGYIKDIDGELGRSLSFLRTASGTLYNEASIIDADITLSMSWRPIIFTKVYYTDCFFIEGVEVPLPNSIANQFVAETITYGSDFTISLFNDLASLNLDDDKTGLVKVLNELDKNVNMDLVLQGLKYSINGGSYTDSKKGVSANTTGVEFNYFDSEDINFGDYDENFPVKFASLFRFTESSTPNAVISFYHDPNDTSHVVGKVKDGDYYGTSNLSDLKCILSSGNVLEVYYASDPRALDVTTTLESFQASVTDSGTVFTVKFHSALVNDVFYPCKIVENVRAVRELVSDTTSIYTKSGNTITPINDWTIETTDLYAEE